MARVLVLTDCRPDDADWKGGFTWRIIQSLAESHHEVLALTPLDLESISITHPRLTVTRPIHSWGANQLPKLAKILLTFQPQVVHVLALKPGKLWPSLSVWPYFTGMCALIPGIKRISTIFDPADCPPNDPAFVWLESSMSVTVFSEQHKAELLGKIRRPIEVVPLEVENPMRQDANRDRASVIPAPVSEWRDPENSIKHLAEYLRRHQNESIKIIGGWGDWMQTQRKKVGKYLKRPEPV